MSLPSNNFLRSSSISNKATSWLKYLLL